MILQVPSYYKEFQCIAGKCRDSCCIGWEIDIDEDTEAYYRSVEGAFGEKLKENMEENSFILRENGWCPFLNKEKLCDICIELGEEALSEVCTEYPRFTIEYPGVREKVLCLSCEEVGRIVFQNKGKIGWECQKLSEEYGEEEWGQEDIALAGRLQQVRKDAVLILQERSCSIEERAVTYLAYINKMQQELSETVPKRKKVREMTPYQCFKERLNQYEQLEVLNEEWESTKRQLMEFFTPENYEKCHREFAKANREREYEYEHLLVYFTCRYFMRSFYDGNLLTKAQFAIVSFLMIRDMDVVRYFTNGKQFSLSDRIDTVRIYAKEVEHSEENIDCLGEDFLFEEVFLVEELEKQILCTEMPRM